MDRYRKKPVEIQAIRFTGESSVEDIIAFTGRAVTAIGQDSDTGAVTTLFIATDEGVMQARRGDWVIKGVEGEVYPCRDSVFEATYEPVERT